MSSKVNKTKRRIQSDYNSLFHRIDNDEPYRASRTHPSDNIDAKAVGQESLVVDGAAVPP